MRRIRPLREFIQLESSGGIILLLAAIAAIIIDNTSLHTFYEQLVQLSLSIHVGTFSLSKPLIMWINDGLMVLFFLLVGLEVKREMFAGELNNLRHSILLGVAALGGMIVPACIYFAFTAHDPLGVRGWAIPAATDTAFSLAILAVLGSRIPASLKVFLTALAIFDDIGAIIVIAIFYTSKISLLMIFLSLACVLLLVLLNRCNVTKLLPYVLIGLLMWLLVLKSGVHTTMVGIVLAFLIPMKDSTKPSRSPLRKMEQRLHPWVVFGVLPIFAFINAGIHFSHLGVVELIHPVTMGIAVGLFVGKQLGICLFVWIVVRLGFADMPKRMTWQGLYGMSLIAGVGFTMSLFIGNLAFGQFAVQYLDLVRLGVMLGSVLSGVLGYFVLHITHPKV